MERGEIWLVRQSISNHLDRKPDKYETYLPTGLLNHVTSEFCLASRSFSPR
ncbi:unnamed protein product, partial [Tuber aestivum]